MAKVITIDGPAASGKTTVSRELARKLGWKWVSTGAFYRGLAFVCVQKKQDTGQEDEVLKVVSSPDWEVRLGPEKTQVFYLGQDVTVEIASEKVGSVASQISQYPKVRSQLLQAQRDCAAQSPAGLVAEGRDCGTVVFPQADMKVYLTANQGLRAARRAQEEGRSVEDTLKDQEVRDAKDQTRKTAPLQVPEDAEVIDTSEMTLDMVVEKIHQIAMARLSS